MAHQPWTRSAAHARGFEEGGVEYLETDVMRFMAILAFCLVAIFALVQSMPLDGPASPPPPQARAEPETEAPAPARPAPADAAPSPVHDAPPATPAEVASQAPAPGDPAPTAAAPEPRTVLVFPPRPRPVRRDPGEVALVVPTARPAAPTRRPVLPPREAAPVPTPAPAQPSAAAPPLAPAQPSAAAPSPAPPAGQRGFSLRFDSDAALRRLVARDEVALYALAHGKAWRVMLVRERLSFRPAQVPASFHEMTPDTVPDEAVTTLRRLVTVSAQHLTWGVTLPAATSRQLNDFLSSHDHGDLVIDADGQLRLERGQETQS